MNTARPLDRETAETYAAWFKALADGTRVQVVSLLARSGAPMTVKEIVAAVPVGQSTVSEHLRKVYGLDMTGEMLELARVHARQAGAGNVEFLRGRIEAIPLPDRRVDVVISNCVINLSSDRAAVFAESFRVLRPGGRLGVTDIVAEDHLTAGQRIERGGEVGCIAGAPSFTEYRTGLAAAGFTAIAITPAHQVADGVHAAIVRAARP